MHNSLLVLNNMNLPTFTVLIVEDLPDNRVVYREYLMSDSSRAYDIIEAGSVAEGLELYSTETIDAILLDYLLPDGDGLKFLETISAQSDDRRPPVVMMTGYGNESIAVRAMKLGAQDYLVKGSCTPQLLISAMHSAIENARLRLQLQYSQEQLQAASEQITTIWESMTDAYISLDRDWRIVYTNSAASQVIERLVGLAPEEFLGKTYWEVFPQSADNFVDRQYRQAVTDRVAVHFEVFYEPIGSWFQVHAYPSTAGVGIYFRDINERKWLEGKSIADVQELGNFVQIVAYDLQAPLRAITHLSEWIEEDLAGALTVANQRQITLLRSRIARISATIDGLLDYTRTTPTEQ
ncbi:response regulator [Chamaesiphon sp.]|uniref:response regulator n=1 Tax=Chamaesiphon sp. TaxID=2814140 RepID=UPI00359300C3